MLILKALAALSEIADQCGKEPAQKSLSLRFLLAYTYVASGENQEQKWLWADYWKHVTQPAPCYPHERVMADYNRATGARSALSGICRAVGFEPTDDFLGMLERYRKASSGSSGPTMPVANNDEPTDDTAA